MKKIALVVAMVIAIINNSAAQQHTRDTITQFSAGSEKLVITQGSKKGNLNFGISGYNFELSSPQKNEQATSVEKFKYKRYFSLLTNIELGVNFFPQEPSYAAYPTDQAGFLSLNNFKSFHLGFDIGSYQFILNKRNTINLHTGVSFMCDNYTFDNNITIGNHNGMIVPTPIDSSYKKSKMVSSYFGIPVELRFKLNRDFNIYAGGYANLHVKSFTKIKFPKEKGDITGLNPVQCGATLRLTYGQLGFFAKYNFAPLFKSSVAPEVRTFTFGINL